MLRCPGNNYFRATDRKAREGVVVAGQNVAKSRLRGDAGAADLRLRIKRRCSACYTLYGRVQQQQWNGGALEFGIAGRVRQRVSLLPCYHTQAAYTYLYAPN